MARALSNSTNDAASSPATEPTTAPATEPTTAPAPAPAPAPSPAPVQPPTTTPPPPPTPATESATAPVIVAASSRGASAAVTICATPGCSRPHRYWRIDQATFMGVRVCCSECTSDPSSSLFATGNDHGHTMECNVAAAARRQERFRRFTVQPSALLPAPTPPQAPTPPPTPSPVISSTVRSSVSNSSRVRSRRAMAREHRRAYEQLGFANGVSEEEMVAQVMALTAEPEDASDGGQLPPPPVHAPAPTPAPVPTPAPAPILPGRPLQPRPRFRLSHQLLRRLWSLGCTGSKTVSSPLTPPPPPPSSPDQGSEHGPQRVRGAPRAALCRQKGGWDLSS